MQSLILFLYNFLDDTKFCFVMRYQAGGILRQRKWMLSMVLDGTFDKTNDREVNEIKKEK